MAMNWNSPNVRASMHECAERYGDGDYCVYLWEDNRREVFYVGSGKNYRYSSKEARTSEFKKWLEHRPCRPLIVAYGMTKEESLDFEMRLIKSFWKRKFPLVNVFGIPENEKKFAEKQGKRMYRFWHAYEEEMGIPKKKAGV